MEALLFQFVDTLDKSLRRVQSELGEPGQNLTVSQLQYVDAVASLSAPTITDIADALDITKASVTAGINRLIKLGYVAKTRSQVDRRMVHITLTAAGERLVAAREQTVREYEAFIRAALTEDEAAQFEHILSKLVALFEAEER